MIGTSLPKIDSYAKVTGAAKYADDLTLPRMAHGRILRSPHPHARILRLDIARARAHPGVLDVITAADLPRRYGIMPTTQDEYPFALDTVRYVGEPVAAVVAVDEETAEEALRSHRGRLRAAAHRLDHRGSAGARGYPPPRHHQTRQHHERGPSRLRRRRRRLCPGRPRARGHLLFRGHDPRADGRALLCRRLPPRWQDHRSGPPPRPRTTSTARSPKCWRFRAAACA